MACCDSVSRNCCVFAVMFSGIFSIIFLIMLIGIMDLSFYKKDEIKEKLLLESPIYDLTFLQDPPGAGQTYIKSFYEFDGREDKKKASNEEKSKIYDKQNITKIYNYYFVHKIDLKSYFDYSKDYTVSGGEACKDNYKKCGIFNSEGRILCLPKEDDCPLNDFAISENPSDSNYPNYKNCKVQDSITNNTYYFYYTNTKTDNNIITTFRLSNGYPCVNSTEKSWISVFDNEVNKSPKCQTTVDGKKTDDRYTQIPGGEITLKSLYADNLIPIGDADQTKLSQKVNLYSRNYFGKNEECIDKYFSDIEKEEETYKSIQTYILILSIISIILMLAIVIYAGITCCVSLKIYLFFIIAHIYGIIENIVSIIITYRQKLEYTCDEDIGFNNEINKILNKNYANSRSIVLGMGILSIVTISLNLIFTICLKNNNNRRSNNAIYNNYGYGTNQQIPIGIMPGMPQNVYVQQNQNVNQVGTPYYTPIVNNQINQGQVPFQINSNINNMPPPSTSSLKI